MKTAKTKTALGKHLQRLGNTERLVKEGKKKPEEKFCFRTKTNTTIKEKG